MKNRVKRIFTEKKPGFNAESMKLLQDIKGNLGITKLESLKLVVRYDIEGLTNIEYTMAKNTIFSEPPVNYVYDEEYPVSNNEKVISVEYLPGQFDQRADSAAQCIQMLTAGEKPLVKQATLIILTGNISEKQLEDIKNYIINPVESQEAELLKPKTLDTLLATPEDVIVIEGFTSKNKNEIESMIKELNLAMTNDDFLFVQDYFKNKEKRDPTITEIKVLDTYWSDHCRHTTFLSQIKNLDFEKSFSTEVIKETYCRYLEIRNDLYVNIEKPVCLMDMATIGMKHLKSKGKLKDLDESEEINACSIIVTADINGESEEWLVMFKNETHNHPTEIEPFGGAATCLGGAIRDPLSGRSYVYQAMRVTGSGDPRTLLKDTLPGKLSQNKITTTAAQGYSSYGNQIGLATGKVTEVYDDGYIAKRMEIGAVVGAVPRKNVKRAVPSKGDVVMLLGGRTGRDGCGGATGSSKGHTEDSLTICGAEVQKGNPVTERKIQRLFRNPELIKLIKRCNDFGAGGVSVAIGELADGLDIKLDAIPKKYEGLGGTELAISESQERMAVVLDATDAEKFRKLAERENLETTVVAEVTDLNRLRMFWRGKIICNIDREFISTNGVQQHTVAKITAFNYKASPLHKKPGKKAADWISHMSELGNASQKGLVEMFDSTIGAGTVLMPFGGKTQMTPSEGMVSKIPVEKGDTSTVTLMAHGYDPDIFKWSPFHGAVYAVIESIARIVAMGGNYKKTWLTLQEYFENLGSDPVKWGKPAAAMLGAFYAQDKLEIAAIGGKDSMSGTFADMSVPPTLVSFALTADNIQNIISNEIKKPNSKLVFLRPTRLSTGLPYMESVKAIFDKIHELAASGKILSCSSVKRGGIAAAVTEMALGNMFGVELEPEIEMSLYNKTYGAFILEVDADIIFCDNGQHEISAFGNVPYQIIGVTTNDPYITIGDKKFDLDEIKKGYEKTLEAVFPTKAKEPDLPKKYSYKKRGVSSAKIKIAKPRVFMPVFPGTNCEYDTIKRFDKAGAVVDTLIIRNMSGTEVEESIKRMTALINNSQIIMIPGGFSAGDEPDGSGKFIATAFRNPKVSEAVMNLLNKRDGLILGICNGFQALIKLGLLPYGEICEINEKSPTLTYNFIGRHVSRYVNTRVSSIQSPWLANLKEGDIHCVPISHGEGRFTANDKALKKMEQNGQIAFQYVDFHGNPSAEIEHNPNGSIMAIEGITSPDGRILGKMGHSERTGKGIAINIEGNKDQLIFESGVEYFTK